MEKDESAKIAEFLKELLDQRKKFESYEANITTFKLELVKQNANISEQTESIKKQTTLQIQKNQQRIITGLIKSRGAEGFYNVTVGPKEFRVKSTLSQNLIPHTEVILGETENGFYIIGAASGKDRTQKTVIISG